MKDPIRSEEGPEFPERPPPQGPEANEETRRDRLRPRTLPLFREPDFEPLDPAPDWSPAGGAALFADAKSSRELLQRLGRGDLLDLATLCMQRVRHEALLVDVSELFLCALAAVAFRGARQAPRDPLCTWLDVRVRRALRDMLEADVRDELQDRPLRDTDQVRCEFLAELLGLEPALGRRACVHFNALPLAERRTFWELKIARRSLHRHVAEGHGPPELARARLQRALEALMRAAQPSAEGEAEERA